MFAYSSDLNIVRPFPSPHPKQKQKLWKAQDPENRQKSMLLKLWSLYGTMPRPSVGGGFFGEQILLKVWLYGECYEERGP